MFYGLFSSYLRYTSYVTWLLQAWCDVTVGHVHLTVEPSCEQREGIRVYRRQKTADTREQRAESR